MIIEKAKVKFDHLKGKTVLVTGGGGGIGYEAARSLAWMGLNVIIAEIDRVKGENAEKTINEELKTKNVKFYHIDLAQEQEINQLYEFIKKEYKNLYAIINNATITPFGAIDVVDIASWDKSYAVNLRAPILLTKMFLPEMKAINEGVIVFVPSSGAAPYMGAYEIFKTSQVELCNTLASELEGTDVYTYSIGPGLVKTETAMNGIEIVSKLMNISTEEFYRINEKHILDAETAGTGFAVSIAFASKYHGQEIGSIQALMDSKIFESASTQNVISGKEINNIDELLKKIIDTFNDQYQGWLKRNIFERQWVLRDFKKEVKISADDFKDRINNISLEKIDIEIFVKLKKYYQHQYKLLQQYEKSPEKLKIHSKTINDWIDNLDLLINGLERV